MSNNRPMRDSLLRYPRQGPLYQGPIFPGNGYPANPGERRPGLSPFGRLAKGQPLGKSSILYYDAATNRAQPAAVPMLQLEGDDLDATQLCVTLAPPRVIPLPFADVGPGTEIGQQNLTGEQGNDQIIGNFPGTAAPIAWPPLEAVLEWGVRGAAARAVVDFTNGVTINIVASYLRVFAAVTQSEDSGGIVGTSAAYYLAAFVGPGWTRTGTAKRTIYVDVVNANAESDVFDIPKFARRAYVVSNDSSAAPVVTVATLRFWQSPNGVAGTSNVGNFLVSGNQPTAFDIPNGAQYFSVLNGGGTNNRFSVVFELAL